MNTDYEQMMGLGDFEIWREGDNFNNPTSGTHVASLWQTLYDGTAGTFTVGQSDGPLAVGAKNGIRWNQTTVGAGAHTYRILEYHIEDATTFNNDNGTLSFYAKAGASTDIDVELVQNFGTGGSPSSEVQVVIDTKTATTTEQQFSITGAFPSTEGKTFGTDFNDFVKLRFYLPASSTFDIILRQARFQRGDEIAPWQHIPQALKQAYLDRYLQFTKISLQGKATAANERTYGTIPYKAEMRKVPDVTFTHTATSNTGGMTTGQIEKYAATALIESNASGTYYDRNAIVKLDARL